MKLLTNSNSGDRESFSKKPVAHEVESYRVLQAAQTKVKKAGLARPVQPEDEDGAPLRPTLDLNLASASPDILGRLLAEYTALCDYAAYASTVADIHLASEEAIFEFTKAKIRQMKTGKVHETKDKTLVDPRVIEAQAGYLEKLAIAKLAKVLVENYQRDIALISREISRRQLELERT